MVRATGWMVAGVALLVTTIAMAEEPANIEKGKGGKATTSRNPRVPERIDQKTLQQLLGGSETTRGMLGPGGLGTGLNDSLGGLRSSSAGFADGGLGGLGVRERSTAATPSMPFKPQGVVVAGGLEKEIVVRILRRHWNETRYCYEKELLKDPTLTGHVKFVLNINEDGTTKDVAMKSTTLKNESTETCIARTAQRWVYPSSNGASTVEWSIVLKKEEPKSR